LLAIGVFPASKEVENEDDDEDDWRSTQYRAKQDKTWAEFNCPFRAEVCIGGARQRHEKAGAGNP
jgi:hypothetical protein